MSFLLGSSCDSDSTTIPFEYERNIYLKVKINDTIGANIMFDTGAYGLFLDSSYNSQKKLDIIRNIHLPHEPSGGLKISVDEIHHYPENIYTIYCKPTFGKHCDGIVGWDLFKKKVVHFNFLKKTLVVSSGFTNELSYTNIPLKMRNNYFYVEMSVAVTDQLIITGEYVLDLGYGGSVYLTGETIRNYKVQNAVRKKVEFGVDWGLHERKKSVGFLIRGKKLAINKFELVEPTIECSVDTTGVLAGGDYLGLLGNRVLEHFDLVMDFMNQQLYLRPNSNYKKRMEFKSFGLAFVDRTDIYDGVVVNAITINSEADKAGVRSGDIITHLNGKSVVHNSAQVIKNFYKDLGEEVTLQLKRNDSLYSLKLKVKEEL